MERVMRIQSTVITEYRWRSVNASNQVEMTGVVEVKDTSRRDLPDVSCQSQADANCYVQVGPPVDTVVIR